MTPPPAVTDEELAEVERLDREATPGPWRVSRYGNVQGRPSRLGTCQQIADVDPLREGEVANREADASLIVAARTLAPRLAREVRAGRLWRTIALALIANRARGNAPDVLRAIAELERMGERVPAVVRLP